MVPSINKSMPVLKLVGIFLNIILVLVVVYFIYDFIQTPMYLKELTKEYNELVDHFQLAVKETAIGYIYIGSKEEGMPVTIQIRTATGELINTKTSEQSPLLYDKETKIIRGFEVRGYIRRDRVYVYSLMVKMETSTHVEYIFDDKSDLNYKDPDFVNPLSNPALWVKENESGIGENQFYEVVVSTAGLFALERAYTFKTIEGLPDTAPVYRDYKKTLNGITKK
jgi:hypothetical protein